MHRDQPKPERKSPAVTRGGVGVRASRASRAFASEVMLTRAYSTAQSVVTSKTDAF